MGPSGAIWGPVSCPKTLRQEKVGIEPQTLINARPVQPPEPQPRCKVYFLNIVCRMCRFGLYLLTL